jgi:hypothetical protein
MSFKQFSIHALVEGRLMWNKRVIIAERNPKQTIAASLVITLPTVYFLVLHFAGFISAWTNA